MPLWNPAVEPDASGQIDAMPNKAAPVGADLLMIEDSAVGYTKAKVLISNLPAGIDTTAIHKATAGEIAAITAKTTPVAADLLLIEDSEAANAKKRATLSSIIGAVVGSGMTEVTSTATNTTTSLTDVLIPSMTMTPGAGNYKAMFSAVWRGSTSSVNVTFSYYVNGVLVAASERATRVTAGGADMTMTMIKLLTAGAGQAVEVRWRVSTGTGTIINRNFILERYA
jgi:hypothetical protein